MPPLTTTSSARLGGLMGKLSLTSVGKGAGAGRPGSGEAG